MKIEKQKRRAENDFRKRDKDVRRYFDFLYKAESWEYEQHVVVIHTELNVEVKMVCQRCLELVTLPIYSECTYAVVKEGANTQSLPKGYDVLELGEDPLDLQALVEEELLLALPIVPAHHPEECQQPAGADEPESSKDEVSRSNPFSVLAQLKRDPNV